MADESQRPIIVKRVKKGGHGHHGGAWKIAYADFVTAMMAFFLLMWLLGSVSQGTLQGISEYFKTPLKVALSGGQGAGDATAVIKGGGTDLTRQAGQVKRSNRSPEDVAAEKKRLKALHDKISADLRTSNVLKFYKDQLRLEMTPDGLKIQLLDEKNRPMFASGSAALLPHTREILRELGYELNAVPNLLSVSGHTDAAPFSGGQQGYSNWELSADRANAARRELILGSMDPSKILRVVGLASANPLNRQNHFSPENRRIEIVILNRDAVDRIRSDGASAETAVPEAMSAPAGEGMQAGGAG